MTATAKDQDIHQETPAVTRGHDNASPEAARPSCCFRSRPHQGRGTEGTTISIVPRPIPGGHPYRHHIAGGPGAAPAALTAAGRLSTGRAGASVVHHWSTTP